MFGDARSDRFGHMESRHAGIFVQNIKHRERTARTFVNIENRQNARIHVDEHRHNGVRHAVDRTAQIERDGFPLPRNGIFDAAHLHAGEIAGRHTHANRGVFERRQSRQSH